MRIPIAWTQPATGNRTQQVVGSTTNNYAIDANSNRILSISAGTTTKTYSHDANGSITSDGTYTFIYDAVNRLIQAKQGKTVKGTYTLNGLGQRVKKVAGNATTLFIHNETGQLLGEYNGSMLIQETVWLGDIPIATIRGSTVYYVHTDHLNTPRKVTDGSKKLRWTWDVPSFGATTPNQNPSKLGTFVYNYRQAGQTFDAETGLHQNYYRDCYDPKTGRYCQSDPIGLRGGINTFAYVSGNPLSFTDPYGLQAIPLPSPPPTIGTTSDGKQGSSGTELDIFATPTRGQSFLPGWLEDLMSPITASSSSDSGSSATGSLNACPPKAGNEDPCKGKRKQLRDHERKYQEYIENPSAGDDGRLAAAYAAGDMTRYTNIINGRIRNLDAQISNFRRQLEECERINGKK